MKKEPVIAIVGATGLAGNEVVSAFADAEIPHSEVKLFASEESAGEIYEVAGSECQVEALGEKSFEGIDIAIFTAGPALSEKYVPSAVKAGVVCVDATGFFSMRDEVPLVVADVNFGSVPSRPSIIASPSAAVVQLAPVLDAIHKEAVLKRVVVSTYESCSGAGKAALDELWGQTLSVFNQRDIEIEAFQHQIAFNVIPQIDIFSDDGYSLEEGRIMAETRKVLGLPSLRITATAVRVPVLYSHCESVNIETENELKPAKLVEILSGIQSLQVHAEPDDYPMPLTAAGTSEIHVGRIRRDLSVENGFNLWVVADNVRWGAALNTLTIVKDLIARANMAS